MKLPESEVADSHEFNINLNTMFDEMPSEGLKAAIGSELYGCFERARSTYFQPCLIRSKRYMRWLTGAGAGAGMGVEAATVVLEMGTTLVGEASEGKAESVNSDGATHGCF